MTKETIENNPTYKAILNDSFGGVMYNLDNADKYNLEDVAQIMKAWLEMSPSEQSAAGGIMKGAIAFIKEEVLKD